MSTALEGRRQRACAFFCGIQLVGVKTYLFYGLPSPMSIDNPFSADILIMYKKNEIEVMTWENHEHDINQLTN